MKLKIVEKCKIEDRDIEGIRIVYYKSSKKTLLDALNDYTNNFDSNNVHDTYDKFEGKCLSSRAVEVLELCQFPSMI